jgi:hypothetical protein
MIEAPRKEGETEMDTMMDGTSKIETDALGAE